MKSMKDYGHDVTHGSIAQMFAVVAGLVALVAGVIGMIINPDFSTGNEIVTETLLFMDVNAWSSLVLLVTGVVLLIASRSADHARKASLVVGVIYLALTVWSLFDSSILGMIPVNDATAILYAAIGVLGVTAGVGPDRHVEGA